MNWLDCLCLSVPPSIALAFAAVILRNVIAHHVRAIVEHIDSMRLNRRADRVNERNMRLRFARGMSDLAEALVKSARYTAGAIKVNPKPEPAEKRTVFQQWMDAEGKHRPAEVQDAMEFAFGFVSGEDSGAEAGDAGTAEGAKAIIERYADASWYSTAVADAKARR